MADLITHGCVALLVKAGTGRTHAAAFVAGTLAPDLLCRLPALVLRELHARVGPLPRELLYAWEPLHQPLGMVLSAFCLSMLFAVSTRRAVFLNLLGGMFLHLLVDMLQRHMGVGYLLLFPFDHTSFEFGWIGSEATVFVAPVLAPLTWLIWRRTPVKAVKKPSSP